MDRVRKNYQIALNAVRNKEEKSVPCGIYARDVEILMAEIKRLEDELERSRTAFGSLDTLDTLLLDYHVKLKE